MAIDVRDYSRLVKFKEENPEKAGGYVKDWRNLAAKNPEINSFISAREFYAWANNHQIDPTIWVGRELLEIQPRDIEATKNSNNSNNIQDQQRSASHSNSGGGGYSSGSRQADFLEEDEDFKNIAEQKKEVWLENNPGKDFTSAEGLDYLYGSLSDDSLPSLNKEAEVEFREKHKDRAELFDKAGKKIFDQHDYDPLLKYIQKNIEAEVEARYNLHERIKNPLTLDAFKQAIEEKRWDAFVAKHPEKAISYSASHQALSRALDRKTIRENLAAYEKTSGKEVKYVEKIHRDSSPITIAQATQRLENIQDQKKPSSTTIANSKTIVSSRQDTTSTQLVSPHGRLISSQQNTAFDALSAPRLVSASGNILSSVFTPYIEDSPQESDDEDHIPPGLYPPQQTKPTTPAATQAELPQNPPQQSPSNPPSERNTNRPPNRKSQPEANMTQNAMKNAAKKAIKKAAISALRIAAPYIGVALLILLLIFLVAAIILHLTGKNQTSTGKDQAGNNIAPESSKIQATLSGDEKKDSASADNFKYTLNIQYKGSNNLTVIAPLPPGFSFAFSSITPKDTTATDITWILTPAQAFVPLTFSTRPPSTYISDSVTQGAITVSDDNQTGGQSTTTAQTNDNNCGGRYTADIIKNPLQKNFGDPNCEISDVIKAKSAVWNILESQDNTHPDIPSTKSAWYAIIACESQFDANSWTLYVGSEHTPDPDGAWGLLQMGSDLRGKGQGANGIYDRGDVYWQTQISNGYNYYITRLRPNGKKIKSYWACARAGVNQELKQDIEL